MFIIEREEQRGSFSFNISQDYDWHDTNISSYTMISRTIRGQ